MPAAKGLSDIPIPRLNRFSVNTKLGRSRPRWQLTGGRELEA
jgi:hypothetical protein